MDRHPALAALLSERGAVTRIAKACNLRPSAVSQWTHVPARHLRTVSEVTGVPLEQLVPEGPQAVAS